MGNQVKVIDEAPICDCGGSMQPQLINVTNFGGRQRYVLEWVCISDEQHDSYVSRIWSQRNND